jgi:hypothetical protein
MKHDYKFGHGLLKVSNFLYRIVESTCGGVYVVRLDDSALDLERKDNEFHYIYKSKYSALWETKEELIEALESGNYNFGYADCSKYTDSWDSDVVYYDENEKVID